MSGKTATLLAILAFVVLVVGSFVWFIASWDREAEEPVSGMVRAVEGVA